MHARRASHQGRGANPKYQASPSLFSSLFASWTPLLLYPRMCASAQVCVCTGDASATRSRICCHAQMACSPTVENLYGRARPAVEGFNAPLKPSTKPSTRFRRRACGGGCRGDAIDVEQAGCGRVWLWAFAAGNIRDSKQAVRTTGPPRARASTSRFAVARIASGCDPGCV